MCYRHKPWVWFAGIESSWFLVMSADQEAFYCSACWDAFDEDRLADG